MTADWKKVAVCINCDHWARYRTSSIGLCLEPTSEMFHLRQPNTDSQATFKSDSCSEYLEIPKMSGPDRPRKQNETSNG